MKGMAEWVHLREQALLRLLGMKRKTLPHQTTYERVLAQIDEAELEQVVGNFFARQLTGNSTAFGYGEMLAALPTVLDEVRRLVA